MSLARELARLEEQERAAAARRVNSELEARLEKFIANNPQLRDHYLAMGGQEVVRRMMLARMARAETAERRQRELQQWVKENPDITAKVDEQVKATVPRIRSRTAVSAVQTQATRQALRGPSVGH